MPPSCLPILSWQLDETPRCHTKPPNLIDWKKTSKPRVEFHQSVEHPRQHIHNQAVHHCSTHCSTPFDRPFDLVFFRSKSSRTWRFFETLPHGCTWMHTVVEPSSAKGKTVRCPKKKKDPSARVLESFILTFISSILARLSHRMDTLWHQACFWIRLCAAMLLK